MKKTTKPIKGKPISTSKGSADFFVKQDFEFSGVGTYEDDLFYAEVNKADKIPAPQKLFNQSKIGEGPKAHDSVFDYYGQHFYAKWFLKTTLYAKIYCFLINQHWNKLAQLFKKCFCKTKITNHKPDPINHLLYVERK